jgi:hypothetical protein
LLVIDQFEEFFTQSAAGQRQIIFNFWLLSGFRAVRTTF